jgi:chemotaxis protein MotB
MAQQHRKKKEESDAPAVGEWMVTFSDCMTLLLCFFVMMLSMSSFDDIAIDRLIGVCPSLSYRSVFPNRQVVKDSLISPIDAVVDWTVEGSEKPTRIDPENVVNPQPIEVVPDTDAYRDRKVIRVSSVRVFHGTSCALSGDGAELLKLIASFVRRLPCQVIISETSRSPSEISLERAWAAMRYFTEAQGLPTDQFAISAGSSVSRDRPDKRPVLEFVLLTRDLHK